MNYIDVQFYKKHGWVLIKNTIPVDTIKFIHDRGLELRRWVEDKVGTPCEFGPLIHWKGVACAGMYDADLLSFYKSGTMTTIASQLLEKEEFYFFNDQIVFKLPNDEFGFDIHRDNEYGNENEDGSIHTVNMGVALNDFTDENGTLEIFDEEEAEWVKPYPSAGDILAINGETYHKSQPNSSQEPRGLYACVYSAEQINLHNFYNDKYTV